MSDAQTAISRGNYMPRLVSDEKHTEMVLGQIALEHTRSLREHGGAVHDDAHTWQEWLGFVREWADKAQSAAEAGEGHVYRERLVQIANLAVAALKSVDRAVGNA
jgi:hypothetical protein